MATVRETCSCGAKFEFSAAGWYAEHNAANAASSWRAAHRVCRQNGVKQEAAADRSSEAMSQTEGAGS